MAPADLKTTLYQLCEGYVSQRISNAQQAISSAQESSNAESKSTAGDKHDTSRAMMQLEVEQASRQLAEAEKLRDELKRIDAQKTYTTVVAGSLVQTSTGIYFVAIAAGKLEVDGQVYFAISVSSPIMQAMKGLKKGETFTFNGKQIPVLQVD